ncbi:MAG: hypothetical protein KKC84_05895, partial [Candidatus Omnitrophica bacterium]|nr:hypothetical protein [Candidatus Omnitrophota bacterium]
ALVVVLRTIYADYQYMAAQERVRMEKLDEALAYGERAKMAVPMNPDYYAFAASLHVRRGELNQALEEYTLALARKQDFPAYLTQRGRVYKMLKDYAHAYKDLTQALLLDRFGAYEQEHYTDLGVICASLGDDKRARMSFYDAVLLDPHIVRKDWPGIGYRDAIAARLEENFSKLPYRNDQRSRRKLRDIQAARKALGELFE